MEEDLLKYPRTPHLEDSRLGEGDSEQGRASLSSLDGNWIVVEEKLDGSNSGISFSSEGELRLQSRGHFLAGGGSERQFNMLKLWASAHKDSLFEALGDSHVMYGEWMAAKHTSYYDQLPHLFVEFDVYDKSRGVFLSTLERQKLLSLAPVVQAPVLYEGFAPSSLKKLKALCVESFCKSSNWRSQLKAAALKAGLDSQEVLAEADGDLMEGLYIKVESGGEAVGRYKWVRHGFHQTLMESGSHWKERPLIRNGLASGVDIFAPGIGWECPGLTGRLPGGSYKAWAQPSPVAAAEAPPRRRSI